MPDKGRIRAEISGWLGWFFCEIAFSWPDKFWGFIPEKSYELGNYFYNIWIDYVDANPTSDNESTSNKSN